MDIVKKKELKEADDLTPKEIVRALYNYIVS